MSNYDQATAILKSYIEKKIENEGIPGLGILLTDHTQVIYKANFAYSDLEQKTQVSDETIFPIASITKTFLSIVVLKLVEKGLLDLHLPVTDYVPWLSTNPAYEKVTIHHLLSHSSGLPGDPYISQTSDFELSVLLINEPGFEPGERFHYSNIGYQLLAYILEKTTGRSFGEMIQKEILDPLEMKMTWPVITSDLSGRLAVGYDYFHDERPGNFKQPIVRVPWADYLKGDGSVVTTTNDMATFMQMLLNKGEFGQRIIISEENFRRMTNSYIRTDWGSHYGYGVMINDIDGHKHIGHGGVLSGYKANMLLDLEDRFGVIIMANSPLMVGEIAFFALSFFRALRNGNSLPSPPVEQDNTIIEKGQSYVGIFRSARRNFTLEAQSAKLVMIYEEEQIILQDYGAGKFYVDHPHFRKYLLKFLFEDDKVVEAFHGGDWYITTRYEGPEEFDYPSEWKAYPGHYRAGYRRGWSNFSILIRKGDLVLIHPWGEEVKLISLGGGIFRLGEQVYIPERLYFDTFLDGKALRVVLTGSAYYRTRET